MALAASVLVDAMGSFSPIARQARRGAKPDSVVLMVGSCARGLPPASTADLLYSITELDRHALLYSFAPLLAALDQLPEVVSGSPLWTSVMVRCRARQLQYFFEAFPARDGLTTYMCA